MFPVSTNYNENASAFERELQTVINKHSKENDSDTPDFILAEYMNQCLAAFSIAVARRERWYGRVQKPVPSDQCPEPPSNNEPIKSPPAT